MDTSYDQHCLAIGRMIVGFQSLEATLKSELTLLMNSESGSVGGSLVYATVAELSFGTTIRVASSLPSIYTQARLGLKNPRAVAQFLRACEETGEELKKGLKLATEVEARRNQIVHSHWFISPGYVAPEGKMTRMKAKTRKGGIGIDFKHESLEDLESVVEMAREAQTLIGSSIRNYSQISQFDWEKFYSDPSS